MVGAAATVEEAMVIMEDTAEEDIDLECLNTVEVAIVDRNDTDQQIQDIQELDMADVPLHVLKHTREKMAL